MRGWNQYPFQNSNLPGLQGSVRQRLLAIPLSNPRLRRSMHAHWGSGPFGLMRTSGKSNVGIKFYSLLCLIEYEEPVE